MSVYNYIVRNSRGESIKGTLDSDSQDSVASKLREMGYFIVNISEAKSEKKFTLTGKKISFSFFNRIKTRDLVIFTRQFSTLIS
jgi:type IV pilus assembly protein PilC